VSATGERLLRILERLHTEVDGAGGPARLCEVAADIVGVSGAGIMLMSGDVPHGSICSSDEVSAQIEELQYTFGEGPCIDAYQQDVPVAEADLSHPAVERWPAFTPGALAAGARALFGFPLHVGSIGLGALNLYSDRPGALRDEQHADALAMAGVAARSVLDMEAMAAPGALASDFELGAGLRLVVHQAAGMVSVQLGISIAEALVRLRAHAFASGRPVVAVAEDVVSRRLRFG
jgi:hypothetical protein